MVNCVCYRSLTIHKLISNPKDNARRMDGKFKTQILQKIPKD